MLKNHLKHENLKIWRYIDFTKYVDFLNSKSLFFSRADKFQDPYEGRLSPFFEKSIRDIVYKGVDSKAREDIVATLDKFRENTYINCWSISNKQSAALWNFYGNTETCIAIQSNLNKFENSFINENNYIIHIDKTKYIDKPDKNFKNNFKGPHSLFIYKRSSFYFETELRAIIQDFTIENKSKNLFKPKHELGVHIKMDLDKLVDNIYVSPLAKGWYYNLVKSITTKFGHNFKIIQSDLYKSPELF